MHHPFSLMLIDQPPDQLELDIYRVGQTALTKSHLAYEFTVEGGSAIRFRNLRTDLDVIIKNTGAQAFNWQDSTPRERLRLEPGEQKMVRIPASIGSLYPYPGTSRAEGNYFKLAEDEISDYVDFFHHPVVCLYFVDDPYHADEVLRDIIEKVKTDIQDYSRYGPYTNFPYPIDEYYRELYRPTTIPLYEVEGSIPYESDDLESYQDGSYRMLAELVSKLARPVPADGRMELSEEKLGRFIGYQYLLAGPEPGELDDVRFYVALPLTRQ